MTRSIALATFLLLGCQAPTGEQHNPITAPTQSGLPPSMSTMVVEGHSYGGESIDEHCHAVLITETMALTAAHCFEDFHPQLAGTISLFGQTISFPQGGSWEVSVRFHPKAWGNAPPHPWTVPQHGADGSSDLAVVFLPQPAFGYQRAKLWNPQSALALNFASATATIGGHAPGGIEAFFDGVTSTEGLIGLKPLGAGHVLEGNRQPSGLEGGDSGGGAFLVPSAQFPSQTAASSGTLFTTCATATAGGANDQVLVGIASSAASTDYWAPTFTYANRSWIAKMSANDTDGDGRCDDVDNCVEVANPGQENCNQLAETRAAWGSDGLERGDACDPVPCASAELEETTFVGTGTIVPWFANGYVICTAELGRSIRDKLLRRPVLAEGASPVSTQTASAYFCDCRDANGLPLTDPVACQLPPNRCVLDPAELGKAPADTAWREISLESGGLPVSQPTSMTYVDGGAPAQHTWSYAADHAAWLAQGWVPPGTNDPSYGPGTDLAGVVWLSDTTTVGGAEHGCPSCQLSSGFVYGLEPDPRAEAVHCNKLPQYKPAPWWTYCAVCGDELMSLYDSLVNPVFTALDASTVVAWLGSSAEDVSELFGKTLLEALSSSSLAFISPSEPLALAGYRRAPRALVFDLERGALVGAVHREERAVVLSELGVELDGFSPRHATATAFSLRSRTAYVVNGRLLFSVGLETGRAATVVLDREIASPLASTYVAASGELLIATDREGSLGLVRVNVETGAVRTQLLDRATANASVWLHTRSDGSPVLSTSGERGHQVDLVVGERSLALEVLAKGEAELATPPTLGLDHLLTSVVQRDARRGVRLVPRRIELSATERKTIR